MPLKPKETKEIKDVVRKRDVIKKSVTGIGQNFAQGAERVADIILDEASKPDGVKAKKITDETIATFKGLGRQFKSDLKGVKPRDFITAGAYDVGRAYAAVGNAFKMLME